ncbi:hypothetical protein MKZ38_007437 [Zalerion maritima]|uniref:Trafficking protein particle complex subunit 11 n=1 Tax=Zalerion maritima TaxID=339359 RepID=A0AAD5RUU8_9PEZI|nr:hypothetical protein MKZ38_007437 [Zalerion maritima]
MEGYPAGSLDHNAPLLIASGLTPPANTTALGDPRLEENAILVRSDLPSVDGDEATMLLQYLKNCDASDLAWNGRHARRHRFRIRTTGRTFLLPPRRARTPEGFSINVNSIPQTPPVLHSPFSPLSPISHLYPDGLIDARWLQKHQDLIPSVYICFYSLINDPALIKLYDSKMKSDITSIKNVLSQSGYKTRLAVVIVGGESSTFGYERIQERLEVIRRGTGLDHKTFLYIPPQESEDQLVAAMDAILASLFTQSMDYYRDMGRHAKKKRSRGITPQPSVPPTSGTSRTLSVQAWNVRYDIKTAVFSEYRQDMDAALRLYDNAYETLFGSDVWQIIPSWSPRWNEARLLADILALRILRCLQWLGHWSGSVRRWKQHRDRISDFVDRRGQGTENYGWEAWQARWATMMAELIDKVDIIELSPESFKLYLEPEKALASERLQPWDLLHHPGYWHQLASRHLIARRRFARRIPENDRKPPETSPSTRMASNTYAYDTYMCPEPHEEADADHSSLILNALACARTEFQLRQQRRLSAEIALDCANEYMNGGNFRQALKLLQPLRNDMTFRSESWWDISERLNWMLRSAAKKARLPDLVVAIDWELLNRSLDFTRNKDWEYDISKSLNHVSLDSKPHVALTDEQVIPFVSVSFAFKSDVGKAGQACPAQLVFTSNAFPGSAPVVLQGVEIRFEGSIKPLNITHKETGATIEERNNVAFSATNLIEDESLVASSEDEEDAITSLTGADDLTLNPGQTRVFEMAVQLREPGEAAATLLKMVYDTDTFSLDYSIQFRDTSTADVWYTPSGMQKRLSRTRPHLINIQPRPPKMDVKLVNNKNQYYTDERIILDIELNNAEDADAITKLDVQVWGEEVPEVVLKMGDREKTCVPVGEDDKTIGATIPVGTLEKSTVTQAQIILGPAEMPVEYSLSIKAHYHLVTDPATPIVQDDGYRLIIINPFEANYELLPRLHPDPWPSLFDPSSLANTADEGRAAPCGLAQKWLLATRYASFATEELQLLDLDISILKTHGSVQCNISKYDNIPEGGKTVSPRTMETADFDVESRRMSLDDPPGQSSMEITFLLKWRRVDSSPDTVNITSLPAPRLFVSGSEPRVVATAEYKPVDPDSVMFLNVVIENPSHHFLTFSVTMDPSDRFAFSGPKTCSLNLLPSSRRVVRYRVLPFVRGAWIRLGLTVKDKYFQKVLRILPTEGMNVDKEGVLVWVPEETTTADDDEKREEKNEDDEDDGK